VAADDWLSAIDAMSVAQKGLRKYGSEMSLVSRATSHNTLRSKPGKTLGSESSRSEDNSLVIDSVADAQHKPRYPRPPGNFTKGGHVDPQPEYVIVVIGALLNAVV